MIFPGSNASNAFTGCLGSSPSFLIDKSNAGKIHIHTSGINYIIIRLPAATHFDQPLSCCLMLVDEHQGNIVYGNKGNYPNK
ncbi:hypothetical protein N7465_007521 [Penicillium sp. CMV-2018d]|nr:hypothetical protein N7465_007521 [Penicillium sp. CMV-2018d]